MQKKSRSGIELQSASNAAEFAMSLSITFTFFGCKNLHHMHAHTHMMVIIQKQNIAANVTRGWSQKATD